MTPAVTIYFDDKTYAYVARFMELAHKPRSEAVQILVARGYIEAVAKPEAAKQKVQTGG